MDSNTPHQNIRKMMEEPNCWRCGQPLNWDKLGMGKTPHLHHNHITGELYGFTHAACNVHAKEEAFDRLYEENVRLRHEIKNLKSKSAYAAQEDNQMSISRLEALLFAIASLHGWHDPKSDAFHLRNPLLLKAFSPKHEKDSNGRRKFPTIAAGVDNGLTDLAIKCGGKSFSKLTPDSTLGDLLAVYGQPATATRHVKNFLRAALHDENIVESQKLGWFIASDAKAAQAA